MIHDTLMYCDTYRVVAGDIHPYTVLWFTVDSPQTSGLSPRQGPDCRSWTPHRTAAETYTSWPTDKTADRWTSRRALTCEYNRA